MKINTDIGDGLEVPEIFVKQFKHDIDEAKKQGVNPEYIHEDIDEDIDEWLIENMEKYMDKIVDKEIAEFLVNYHVCNIGSGGGYPIENWMEFEDNGYKYHICAFGWTFECQDSSGALNMIGWKETVQA